MSFWIEHRENGRATLTLAQGGNFLIVIFACGLLASLTAFTPALPLFFLATGFACFLAAKLSVLRRGVSISWGSRGMSPGYAQLYRAGYFIMGVGALMSVPAILLTLKSTLRH